MNPREGALKVLYEINVNEAFSNIALNKELNNESYNLLDRNLLTELVYGVLENQIYIDHVLSQFSNFQLDKMNPYTLNLLRLGIYQLLFLDRVPSFAAVNETVNLSKKYCKKTTGFINGVLRNVQRNRNNIKMPKPEKNRIKYLSIRYSHPEWLVQLFLKHFDVNFVEELLKANNKKPDVYLRINTLKISVADCIQLLEAEGYVVEQSKIVEEAIVVKGIHNIEKTDFYKKGYIQIQDISSMLVAKALAPKEGELVMDICSAPGGKTTHIAQLMNNKGKIIARDIHEHKLKLIDRTAKRLGIHIIQTEKFSGDHLDESFIHKADKVLVDAPCSGLGIIRRKPEIKYRKEAQDITSIVELQYKILKTAAQYVKIEGTLVYSTCTINPEENDHIVQKFLEQHQNYTLVHLNNEYQDIILQEPNKATIQLYPNINGTDGFFIAKFKRIR